eukprot:g17169.t1
MLQRLQCATRRWAECKRLPTLCTSWHRRHGGLVDLHELDPRSFLIVEVKRDRPGVLGEILELFTRSAINMTHIESSTLTIQDAQVQELMKAIKGLPGVYDVLPETPREVPWFPMNIRELDLTVDTLDGGTELINEDLRQDHPGFNDPAYRERRFEIVSLAKAYKHGEKLPRVRYTEQETATWQAVYERLGSLHDKWACREYREMLPQMEKYCGYAVNNIPQLGDISDFLQQRTGFTLRPISGLLSARDFLNALAFRVFYSTQYIRHHGNPFYTPEPDICHELLGHVPLFANPAFADFSQEIGLASLAATDEDVAKLAAVYWFTVEFGLLREGEDVKAFGAGVLSSFGEMEWACADVPSQECREMGSMKEQLKPILRPLDPWEASKQEYPITTYQPVMFCAESLEETLPDAEFRIAQFCDSLTRPFFPQYDPLTQTIRVTKAIRRATRHSTVELQRQKQMEFFEKGKSREN